MINGYVRHSLNNKEALDKQIEKLTEVDRIVIEDNGDTQLHNLITNMNKDDSIVVVSIDRLKNMSLEDLNFLKENEISITSLDGFHSDYKPESDEQNALTFIQKPLYDLLEDSIKNRDKNK